MRAMIAPPLRLLPAAAQLQVVASYSKSSDGQASTSISAMELIGHYSNRFV